MDNSLTSVKRDVLVRTTLERVWQALTVPAECNLWQTTACEIDLRVGGKVRSAFGWGVWSEGTIVELDPLRKMTIQDSDGEGQTIWTLAEEPGGVRVTVEYTGLWSGNLGHYTAENMGFGTLQFLRNLCSFIESGVDQRNQFWQSWIGVAHTTVRVDHGFPEEVSGTWVLRVSAGTPAAAAGIEPEDVITGIDGHPVQGYADLEAFLSRTEPGRTVNLDVVRGQQSLRLPVILAPHPQPYSA